MSPKSQEELEQERAEKEKLTVEITNKKISEENQRRREEYIKDIQKDRQEKRERMEKVWKEVEKYSSQSSPASRYPLHKTVTDIVKWM